MTLARRGAVLFAVVLAALLLAACPRGSSSREILEPGGLEGAVDTGDPVLAPAPGYAGSATCSSCHEEIFREWSGTFHANYVRETTDPGATGRAVVADANQNQIDDFRDGLDLATDPDFAALGANAPELSFVTGDEFPYKVSFGSVTYDVWRTIGGNGAWKQQYLTRVGLSVYVLPIEYDEKTRNWVPFDTDVWYGAGGVPLFTNAATVASAIDPADSADLRCAGCHATGFRVEYDAAADQYVTGYQDLTVGCENCHGPALAHVNSGGDPSLVLNPEDLLDGSLSGVMAADMLCARCHVRGHGDVPAGGSHPTGYPWRTNGSTFPPGQTNLEEYVVLSTDPLDYWEYKDNPLGFAPTPADSTDDTYLASRDNYMQWNDLLVGPHAPDRPFDSNCFECHDPHSAAEEHQIRTRLTHRGTTYTGITHHNNKLCLVCHHGFGDFAGVNDAQVQAITDESAPTEVVDAVVRHMKNRAAMPVDPDVYDPEAGPGRCTLCHMVKTMKSAVFTADAAGNAMGDLHGHTFQPVWPRVSEVTTPPVTNSCNVCHPLGPSDEVADIISQWAEDREGDGTFHADTPRNFQNGVANPTRNGGQACVTCHTTPGFLAAQVEAQDIHLLNDPGSADERTAIIRESIRRDMGITCEACHGEQPDGTFADGPNPLRFPPRELCENCHNSQTVEFRDYALHGELVRHPQQEMYEGFEGAEVPGYTYTNSPHTTFVGKGCIGCHYNPAADGNHTFNPTVNQCRVCHPGLLTFDRTAQADWDGDGAIEGIRTELTGSLARLADAILAAPTSTGATINFEAGHWAIDGDAENTEALDPEADEALLRAMYNYDFVTADGSQGIHNPRYALQLVQSSWEALTGNPWPGARR